jgi:hypothetical protein
VPGAAGDGKGAIAGQRPACRAPQAGHTGPAVGMPQSPQGLRAGACCETRRSTGSRMPHRRQSLSQPVAGVRQ